MKLCFSDKSASIESFHMNVTRPNFVLFFTDQQRWDTLGLNGNPQGLTPHLDRLARTGTFFRFFRFSSGKAASHLI